VRRGRTAADGRVVMVELTGKGRRELDGLRGRYLAVLNERLARLPDRQLQELRAASGAIQVLIDALRDGA